MVKEKREKLIYGMILFVLIMMPVVKLLKIYSVYLFKSSFFVSWHYAYILWATIPFLLIFTFLNIKDKQIRLNRYTVCITLLLLLFGISANIAQYKDVAIFGFLGRKEGLLSFLSYYLLLLNASTLNKKYIKGIIKTVLIIGLLQVLYGFLQVVCRFKFIYVFQEPYMASGFCGNPNFFGTYMTLCLCLSIGSYILLNKGRKFYFINSLIFAFGLVSAQSLTPFLGFVLSFIFMMILFKIKKIPTKIFKIGLPLLLTFIVSIIFLQFTSIYIYKDNAGVNLTLSSDVLRMFGFSVEKISEVTGANPNYVAEFGTGRFKIWANTLEIIQKYPQGVGLDSLYYFYPQCEGCEVVTKVHNEYLHITVTAGILAGIIYLLLLFFMFLDGVKTKDSLALVLFFAFLGYAIGAFANVSVVDIAPIYYIIMGLLIGIFNQKEETH